jgi:hypothetical protein
MIGATKISDGNDNVVATGKDGNDDDIRMIQVVIDQDNGLQVGAFYKITMSDGTGYRSICYTGTHDNLAEFDCQNATKF